MRYGNGMCGVSSRANLFVALALHTHASPHLVVGADPRLGFHGPPDSLVDFSLLVLGHTMHPKCFGIFFVLRLGGRLQSCIHAIFVMVNEQKHQQQQLIQVNMVRRRSTGE